MTQIEAMHSVRKSYDFNPSSRVVQSKKLFKRHDKFKKTWKDE